MVGRDFLYYYDRFILGMVVSFILVVLSFIYINNRKNLKRSESIVLFVFTLFTTIPLNATVCFCLIPELFIFKGVFGIIVIVMSIPLMYATLVSAEEIVVGLIGRLIWPHQKRFFD